MSVHDGMEYPQSPRNKSAAQVCEQGDQTKLYVLNFNSCAFSGSLLDDSLFNSYAILFGQKSQSPDLPLPPGLAPSETMV